MYTIKRVLAMALAALALSGCATMESTLISFAPVYPLQPQSGEELLAALNARVPFVISEQDFRAWIHEREGLVARVAVHDRAQGRMIQRVLNEAAEFRLRYVGYFPAEHQDLFMNVPPLRD